jgi:DNA-binding transcriptional MerR regulator
MTTYRISGLASRTGTTPATLRFYEQEGLLPAARSAAGYRLYGEDAVQRLEFIADAKRLGLPLGEIRGLLAAWDEGECAGLRDRLRPLLAARIAEAQRQAADATALAGQLTAVLSHLAAAPAVGRCDPGCCLAAPAEVAAAAGEGAGAAAGMATVAAPASLPAAGMPALPLAERCQLPADGQARQLGQWRDLLALARQVERADGGARVRLPASAAAQAVAVAVAEVQCCPFFAFTLHLAPGEALLDIRVPADLESGLPALLAGGAG